MLDCYQALPVQAGYQWDLGRRQKPHFLWRKAQSNGLASVLSAAMILDDFREAAFFCVGPRAILIPSYISLTFPVASAICIWEQSLSQHGFCCWRPRSSGPFTRVSLVHCQGIPFLEDRCHFHGMCFDPIGRLAGFLAKGGRLECLVKITPN